MNQESPQFAYILACIDPAIRDELARIYNARLGKGNYFMPTELGGVKDLVMPEIESDRERLLRKIKEAAEVHHFSLVILINHSQCGAYRLAGYTFDDPKKEEKFHADQLTDAEKVIRKEFPGVAVEKKYFLKAEQRMAWGKD